MEEFRSALIGAGAEFLDPTCEWEVMRYRLDGKTGIIYRNKKGRITPAGAAVGHHRNFEEGRAPLIYKADVKRSNRFMLYTDASNYHASQAGSWAGILVLPDGSEHEAHGPLRGEVNSSTSAEARAVANCLHHFGKAGLLPAGAVVRVVCDNSPVINYINGSRRSRKGQVREAVEAIRTLRKQLQLRLSGEWIKGHQPLKAEEGDPRIAYNRRCDKLAKEHSQRLHQERTQRAAA